MTLPGMPVFQTVCGPFGTHGQAGGQADMLCADLRLQWSLSIQHTSHLGFGTHLILNLL